MAADQPLKTYRGNCHCAAFVFEFKAPEITEAYECNCSICRKKGYLLVIPAEDSFGVVEGSEDQLTTYSYGEGKYEHKVRLPLSLSSSLPISVLERGEEMKDRCH